MKNIITLLIALCATLSATAQSLTIHQSETAKQALAQIKSIESQQPSTTVGYRIGIFFDNGQDARSRATEAKNIFAANFPYEPVYMVYQSPYYKVSAGDCLTEEEAIILFERIRPIFPNAFVMREKMDIDSFIVPDYVPVPVVDSLLIVPTKNAETSTTEE